MATVYGYARVSTAGQAKNGNSLEAQDKLLRQHGATEIYADHFTGTKTERPELDKLIAALRPGDTLIITKLDRMARSLVEGLKLLESLAKRKIRVNVLNMGVLDDTPAGRLHRNMLLAIAEFERDMIIERTREGKEIAKQRPGFKEGRPKEYDEATIEHALKLLETNSYNQVSKMLKISKSTLQRAKREATAKSGDSEV